MFSHCVRACMCEVFSFISFPVYREPLLCGPLYLSA